MLRDRSLERRPRRAAEWSARLVRYRRPGVVGQRRRGDSTRDGERMTARGSPWEERWRRVTLFVASAVVRYDAAGLLHCDIAHQIAGRCRNRIRPAALIPGAFGSKPDHEPARTVRCDLDVLVVCGVAGSGRDRER